MAEYEQHFYYSLAVEGAKSTEAYIFSYTFPFTFFSYSLFSFILSSFIVFVIHAPLARVGKDGCPALSILQLPLSPKLCYLSSSK